MRKWILSVLFVAAIVLIAWWAIGRLMGTSQADRPALPAAMAVAPTQQNMQSQLMDPALDLKSREMLIEKIELEKRAEANQKAGETNPAPKIPNNQLNGAVMPAQLQVETGIFEGSEGMVRPDQALISNYWRGILNGKVLIAFAGSKAGNDKQGMIVLVTSSLDPTVSDTQFKNYFAPPDGGKLRVIAEKDGILVLQRANGGLIKFDLATKTFSE